VPFGACGLDVPRFPEDAAAAALDNLKHLTALAEWVAASISRNRRSLAPCSLPGCNRAASTFRAQLHLFYAEPRLPGSGFGTGLVRLVSALDTDLDWLREHTRLLQRASEWDSAGRTESRLLFGDSIAEAKAWAARRPKDAAEPTALHYEFVRASEAAEARRQDAERQQLEQVEAAQTDRAKALAQREEAQDREAEQARRVVRRTLIGMAVAIVLFLATAVLAVGLVGSSVEADQRSQAAAAQRGTSQTAAHGEPRPITAPKPPGAGKASGPFASFLNPADSPVFRGRLISLASAG
jgi:hypothetical protein